jgi:hypothetical protein
VPHLIARAAQRNKKNAVSSGSASFGIRWYVDHMTWITMSVLQPESTSPLKAAWLLGFLLRKLQPQV